MATKQSSKKVDEENKEETIESVAIENEKTDSNSDIDYKAEYEKMKNEFSEMKELMAQVLKSQENPKTVSEDKSAENTDMIYEDIEAKIIPMNKIVYITNLFDGKMYLTGMNNKPINFEDFGVTLPVTWEDLQQICSTYRSFAEKGYFFIHNKDMVQILNLNDAYKKIIDKNMIEDILKLTDNQIKDILSNITDTIKETILNVIVKGVKDNNPKYTDARKISLIGTLLNKDIYKTAQQLRDLEK